MDKRAGESTLGGPTRCQRDGNQRHRGDEVATKLKFTGGEQFTLIAFGKVSDIHDSGQQI